MYSSCFLGCFFIAKTAQAAVTITPASGGAAISADTSGGSYTVLTGPTATEGASRDIPASGTFVLNAPSGFSFNTGTAVTATRALIGCGQRSFILADSLSGRIVSVGGEERLGYVNPFTRELEILDSETIAWRRLVKLAMGVKQGVVTAGRVYPREWQGRILLEVANGGRLSYIWPQNLQAYYLANAKQAWAMFKKLSQSVSQSEWQALQRE